jgi:maltose O-acetyltransferase
MSTRSSRLYLVGFVFPLIPPTRLYGLKRSLLRWCGIEIGAGVRVASSARFIGSGSIRIGTGTWIGHEVLITGGDALIDIGADVDIAPRVLIVGGSHIAQPGAQKAAGTGVALPVRIGDGCWIGAGATILGGANIGVSAVIAAGSLVRGTLEGGKMYGGVPARLIEARGNA